MSNSQSPKVYISLHLPFPGDMTYYKTRAKGYESGVVSLKSLARQGLEVWWSDWDSRLNWVLAGKLTDFGKRAMTLFVR